MDEHGPNASGTAILVLLPDGAVRLYSHDVNLRAADVTRDFPGLYLAQHARGSHRPALDPAYPLRPGGTYFLFPVTAPKLLSLELSSAHVATLGAADSRAARNSTEGTSSTDKPWRKTRKALSAPEIGRTWRTRVPKALTSLVPGSPTTPTTSDPPRSPSEPRTPFKSPSGPSLSPTPNPYWDPVHSCFAPLDCPSEQGYAHSAVGSIPRSTSFTPRREAVRAEHPPFDILVNSNEWAHAIRAEDADITSRLSALQTELSRLQEGESSAGDLHHAVEDIQHTPERGVSGKRWSKLLWPAWKRLPTTPPPGSRGLQELVAPREQHGDQDSWNALPTRFTAV